MTWRHWWRYHINISILHSKLMFWCCFQIYLPALKGYVLDDMIHALHAFLDFCYLAHHDVLNTQLLAAMQDALDWFHQYHKIFCTCGVCSSFNLPHQHSLTHFIQMIWAFGAPNRLCSSIMELKHIKAVKNLIKGWVIMKPLGRCYWLTNVSTSLQQHELTSRGVVCWTAPAYCMLFSLSTSLVSFNAHSNSYHTDQSIL